VKEDIVITTDFAAALSRALVIGVDHAEDRCESQRAAAVEQQIRRSNPAFVS